MSMARPPVCHLISRVCTLQRYHHLAWKASIPESKSYRRPCLEPSIGRSGHGDGPEMRATSQCPEQKLAIDAVSSSEHSYVSLAGRPMHVDCQMARLQRGLAGCLLAVCLGSLMRCPCQGQRKDLGLPAWTMSWLPMQDITSRRSRM